MKIALYDIDFTLLPFDSFAILVKHLVKKKLSNMLKLPFLAIRGLAVALSLESLTSYKSAWLSLTNHLNDEELDNFSKDFVNNKIIPFIKEDVIDHIETHRKQGYTIVFATASFSFYLKYLAEYCKADYFFGTEYFKSGNKRKIFGLNCKGVEKISRILKQIPIESIDKENSVGFSDSMADFPYTTLTGEFSIIDKYKWKTLKTFSRNHSK